MSDEPLKAKRSDAEDAAIWERFAGRPGEDAKVSAVHRLRIAGNAPEGFGLHMRQIIPPDELRGEMLMRGVWRIGMDRLELEDGGAPWSGAMPSRHYANRLHRFDWLPDLFTQGDVGADRARFLVDDWIENFGRFDGFSWRMGCAGDRVWNWMRCGAALFETGLPEACEMRLEALGRQARHVLALVDAELEPKARWRGTTLAVAHALCLGRGKGLDDALMRLESECTAQFFPDGGHVSRSPARALSCLADLITIHDLLSRSDREVPEFLDRWIARIGGMVAFFRAGDDALMPFHDGDERWPEAVEAVLAHMETPPRRFSVAPKSGFHKLQKGATVLVLDAGAAPEPPFGDKAHAGALGFELHDGPARIVTSCACSPEIDIAFRAAVRHTSAHSTLVLGDEDSSRFKTNEDTRLLYPVGPQGISAKRLEEDDEIWLDAQHGGYKQQFGLLHRRRLFMSGDGKRLTGEDSLARPVSAGATEDEAPIVYDLRFHLHPTVEASMAGDSIVLRSNLGSKWRFKTSHAQAKLEETIYLGRGIIERSQQIVLSGKALPNSDGSTPPNCIRWAFLKVEGA
ncbi:MAG: heparinase II/III family protein [Hyphomonadaceae bacterium]|nr:heparinase II/III family protein [Hyphomonadaceae bacterium]